MHACTPGDLCAFIDSHIARTHMYIQQRWDQIVNGYIILINKYTMLINTSKFKRVLSGTFDAIYIYIYTSILIVTMCYKINHICTCNIVELTRFLLNISTSHWHYKCIIDNVRAWKLYKQKNDRFTASHLYPFFSPYPFALWDCRLALWTCLVFKLHFAGLQDIDPVRTKSNLLINFIPEICKEK